MLVLAMDQRSSQEGDRDPEPVCIYKLSCRTDTVDALQFVGRPLKSFYSVFMGFH